MNLHSIVRTAGKSMLDNAPAIMTGMAVAGTISTAVLTGKAAYKASVVLEDYKEGLEEITTKEKLELTWHLYLPAAVSGASTIALIVGAHTTLSKRHAAVIGAYSIAETAMKEYREKVVEVLGESKETKLREEIAKERLERDPVTNSQVIITGLGDQLCYDVLTGRYFRSDIEKIRRAQNDINQKVINEGNASQNDFYALIGLESTGMGEDLGWTTDNMMDIFFSTHLSSEGQACLSLEYHSTPVRDYWKISR